MKKIFILILILFLILLLTSLGYFYQEPLRFIDAPVEPLKIKHQTLQRITHGSEKRNYLHITFQRSTEDTFLVTISRPFTPQKPRLPVIILLGGLEIGRHSLSYIPKHGQNIIVAYEYPYRPRYWYQGHAIEQIPLIRHSVLIVPAQVTQLVNWIKQQAWADTNRISLLGYSFGALALPAILRVMQKHNLRVQGVIMAYGGVNLYQIIKANLKTIPSLLRAPLSFVASMAIRPVEPQEHLPYLEGPFLLINGQQDRQIPEPCWRSLHELTPQPKTIVILKAGHLHPKNKTLINTVIAKSYQWLKKRNLINTLDQ